MSNLREDIAPYRDIVAPAVVEHHDAAGRHVVDIVTDRTRRTGGWPIQQRVGAARKAKLWIERRNAVALSGDAAAIERVAERGGVQSGGAPEIRIVRVFAHFCRSSIMCSYLPPITSLTGAPASNAFDIAASRVAMSSAASSTRSMCSALMNMTALRSASA